jgi:ABC-type polysaccharide/polyol phosphate export permease
VVNPHLGTLSGLQRQWPLFENLVRREISQRYKGSSIGLIWTLITPAIMVVTYSLVFRVLLRFDSIPNYALFLFVGLVAWQLFMGSVLVGVNSLVGQANLVKKVSFPRELIPLSVMSANGLTALAMLAIALPLCVVFQNPAPAPFVLLPLLLALLMVLAAGLGLLVSALNVYFRDVEHIITAVALPWFFLSPIFYDFDNLPGLAGREWAADLLHYLNPVSPFIIAIKDVMFWGRWPDPLDIGYMAVAATAMIAIGLWAFAKLSDEMANEL